MNSKSEIFEYLKNNSEDVIPVKGLKLQVELPSSSEQLWQPDFFVHTSFKQWQFTLVGEVLTQKSSTCANKMLSLCC